MKTFKSNQYEIIQKLSTWKHSKVTKMKTFKSYQHEKKTKNELFDYLTYRNKSMWRRFLSNTLKINWIKMNKCQWIQNSSIIPSFLHLWDYLRDLKSLSTPLHSPPPYTLHPLTEFYFRFKTEHQQLDICLSNIN